jgi:1-deoxy-D-xylulose-5-phosphate synthase
VHSIGVPLEFIEHSKRNEILEDLKITPAAMVQQIAGWIS